MRLRLPIFLTLMLSACSTVPDAGLLEHRQAVQEKTRPKKVMECHCPAYNPEGEAFLEKGGPHMVAEGQIGDFPEDFSEVVKGGSSFEAAVNDYAMQISSKPSLEGRNSGIHCWTGVCPIQEYFISDLKDFRKTWVYLSQYPKAYAHKCTYSDNPNVWTTEECPEAKAGLMTSLRNVR